MGWTLGGVEGVGDASVCGWRRGDFVVGAGASGVVGDRGALEHVVLAGYACAVSEGGNCTFSLAALEVVLAGRLSANIPT